MVSSLRNSELREEGIHTLFIHSNANVSGNIKDDSCSRILSINQRYQTAHQEALSHFDPFEKQLPDIPLSFG